LVAARAGLEQRQIIIAVLRDGYEAWRRRLKCLAAQVEEVGEMLDFTLQEKVAAYDPSIFSELGGAVDWGVILYDRLTEGGPAEAERAAAAIGGLGRQLVALDDINEILRNAGRERLAAVSEMTAGAGLALAAGAGLDMTAWWNDMMNEAAPLWPGDGRDVAGVERDVPVGQLFVLAKDIDALRDLLGLPEAADRRWIEVDKPETISVIRAANATV
jgi:hypothetical protein